MTLTMPSLIWLQRAIRAPMPWALSLLLTVVAYGPMFTAMGTASYPTFVDYPREPLPKCAWFQEHGIGPTLSVCLLWVHQASYRYPVWALRHGCGTSSFWLKDSSGPGESWDLEWARRQPSFYISMLPFWLVWYFTLLLMHQVIRSASCRLTRLLQQRHPWRWWILSGIL